MRNLQMDQNLNNLLGFSLKNWLNFHPVHWGGIFTVANNKQKVQHLCVCVGARMCVCSPLLSSHRVCRQPRGWGQCGVGVCTSCAQRPPLSGWPSSAPSLWYPYHQWGLTEGDHQGNVSVPPETERERIKYSYKNLRKIQPLYKLQECSQLVSKTYNIQNSCSSAEDHNSVFSP